MKTPYEIMDALWAIMHTHHRLNNTNDKETLQQIIKLLKDEGVISQSPSMFDAQ